MTDTFRTELEAALGDAYTIERELTGGGMSRVFVAVERALGRRVVIKVLPPDLAAGVNSERFRREIQLAAQLQHPHIVPLLSAGEHGRLLYYTMPFIEGESLRARVDRVGKLPVREVMRILVDVVEALAYAHDRGVIHRDIKPGNVLMQGPHALITDFGVAKALNAALPSSGATSTGMAIGTPAYMAPEQLAGDPKADNRVDLYAVGLLAYELLTGKSPFASMSPQATMAAQLTRDPDPLDRSYPEVPPALAALISACLRKEADERPSSAGVLLDSLERFAAPGDATVRIPTAPARRRTRTAALAAVGLALVTTAVVAAVRWYSPGGTNVPSPQIAGGLAVGGDTAIASTLETSRPRDTVFVERTQPAVTERVLTRDDSLAIAEAVARRERELRGQGTSADRIQEAIQVARFLIVDSLLRIAEKDESLSAALGEAQKALQQLPDSLRGFDPRRLLSSRNRPAVSTDIRGTPDIRLPPNIGVTLERGGPDPPVDPGPAVITIFPFRNGTGRAEFDTVAQRMTQIVGRSLGRHPTIQAMDVMSQERYGRISRSGDPPTGGVRQASLEGTLMFNPRDSTIRVTVVLRPVVIPGVSVMAGWSSPRVFRSPPGRADEPMVALAPLLESLTRAVLLEPRPRGGGAGRERP